MRDQLTQHPTLLVACSKKVFQDGLSCIITAFSESAAANTRPWLGAVELLMASFAGYSCGVPIHVISLPPYCPTFRSAQDYYNAVMKSRVHIECRCLAILFVPSKPLRRWQTVATSRYILHVTPFIYLADSVALTYTTEAKKVSPM